MNQKNRVEYLFDFKKIIRKKLLKEKKIKKRRKKPWSCTLGA